VWFLGWGYCWIKSREGSIKSREGSNMKSREGSKEVGKQMILRVGTKKGEPFGPPHVLCCYLSRDETKYSSSTFSFIRSAQSPQVARW
jgi:hypothetical protein